MPPWHWRWDAAVWFLKIGLSRPSVSNQRENPRFGIGLARIDDNYWLMPWHGRWRWDTAVFILDCTWSITGLGGLSKPLSTTRFKSERYSCGLKPPGLEASKCCHSSFASLLTTANNEHDLIQHSTRLRDYSNFNCICCVAVPVTFYLHLVTNTWFDFARWPAKPFIRPLLQCEALLPIHARLRERSALAGPGSCPLCAFAAFVWNVFSILWSHFASIWQDKTSFFDCFSFLLLLFQKRRSSHLRLFARYSKAPRRIIADLSPHHLHGSQSRAGASEVPEDWRVPSRYASSIIKWIDSITWRNPVLIKHSRPSPWESHTGGEPNPLYSTAGFSLSHQQLLLREAASPSSNTLALTLPGTTIFESQEPSFELIVVSCSHDSSYADATGIATAALIVVIVSPRRRWGVGCFTKGRCSATSATDEISDERQNLDQDNSGMGGQQCNAVEVLVCYCGGLWILPLGDCTSDVRILFVRGSSFQCFSWRRFWYIGESMGAF